MKKSFRCVTAPLLSLAVLAATCLPAWAKPNISVSITTEKEVVVMEQGKKVVKKVPAKAATSGDVLHYTLTYVNKGNEPAANAVINNPVPKGTVYVANSATGTNTEITFSNDGGKTYAPPVKLTYEVKLPSGEMEKRISTPSDYTNIRWTIKSIAPSATGTVGFMVHIK
ncbi:MAG: hypothetical protein WC007_07985 [Pelobacteraceae bacterium]